MKFYKCKVCGQILAVIKDTGVKPYCCNEEMEELSPKTNETNLNEKHIPIFKTNNGKVLVQVGEIPHPMTDDHYIEWIVLTTNKGNQTKELKPGKSPRAEFRVDKDEKVEEIYAYCNIHNLWKLDHTNCHGCQGCKK